MSSIAVQTFVVTYRQNAEKPVTLGAVCEVNTLDLVSIGLEERHQTINMELYIKEKDGYTVWGSRYLSVE